MANHFTTFRRLDEELRKSADEIMNGRLDYDFEYTSFYFVKEGDLMELERDMRLDIHNPPTSLNSRYRTV